MASRKRLDIPSDTDLASREGVAVLGGLTHNVQRFLSQAAAAPAPVSVEDDSGDADNGQELEVHMNLVLGVLEGRQASLADADVLVPTPSTIAAVEARNASDAEAFANLMKALVGNTGSDDDSSVAFDEDSSDDDEPRGPLIHDLGDPHTHDDTDVNV